MVMPWERDWGEASPAKPWERDWGGTEQPKNYAAADVAGAAVSNLPSDFMESFVSPLKAAVSDIPGTVKRLGKTGIGMVQEFIPGQQQYETQYADPFYKGLYGDFGVTWDKGKANFDKETLKRNLAEHPVRMGLNASLFLAPFESAPGTVGKVATALDPITMTAKGVSNVAKIPAKAAKYVTGEMSGLGPQAISEAYRSGKVGGIEGETFRAHARGYADSGEPVSLAKEAVSQLRKERSSEYTAGMAPVKADTTVLSFKPIENDIAAVAGVKRFKGEDISKATADIRGQINSQIEHWKSLDPKEYHTPEGLDALKQSIGDIRDATQPYTPARRVADAAYHAVRGQIIKQAPAYAKTMKAYERASTAIDEVTRTFSLGNKSLTDTSLRKLQSILRNNAFTNWGARAKLAELISKKVPELMPALAGQATNTILPRGLPGKLLTGGAGIAGIAHGGGVGAMTAAIIANPLSIIPMLATLAAGSPKVVGEAAHAAGRTVGAVKRSGIGPLAREATRLTILQDLFK